MAAAFDAVPRAGFLPRAAGLRPEFDGPLSIGHGQTSSQPRTVEAMLRLLEVRPGDRVLDLGSGSGWTAALSAHLTGPEGSVLGVELVPELAAWGAKNLARAPYSWASIQQSREGVLGLPERAPYDRVLVSAEAQTMPLELVTQLADGGRIVVPVRGTMTLGVLREGGLQISEHGRYRFVPLL